VFTAIQLTGKEIENGGFRYSETKDGAWVKNINVRITRPGAPPKDLLPNERWVDVNLKEQTLVVYEGTKAVYATLISSGKESTDKDKDHRTPTGEWRIREKHVTTTMDGDGSAAGDLPYSIEDVPYVMYFHQSYALHGAFWHRNFGLQMSHGCVNLAPLDAKWVFQHTDPPLPSGWHGAWSNNEHPGSRVVVHE
jgi:lipoprotein-anchoring transpeptidase ErfK/SrfK